jgi:inhibitor of cysteine peptidase
MKKFWLVAICIALIIPAFAVSCSAPGDTSNSITISCDEFQKQANMTREVQMTIGKTLAVSLCSNKTTGFSWSEKGQIGNSQVIEQTGYKWVSPQDTGKVGVPGNEQYTFRALKPGTSNISFGYSRPWQGGEQNVNTLKLNVTVK